MPGRGNGERLAVDPKNSNILFFGARSGNGLWKSTDAGASFQQVTTFTAVGNFAQNPNDTSGYMADLQGLTFVTFDETSEATADGATSRIFAGSASTGDVQAVWVSTDAGETWSPLEYVPPMPWFLLGDMRKLLYTNHRNVKQRPTRRRPLRPQVQGPALREGPLLHLQRRHWSL